MNKMYTAGLGILMDRASDMNAHLPAFPRWLVSDTGDIPPRPSPRDQAPDMADLAAVSVQART